MKHLSEYRERQRLLFNKETVVEIMMLKDP